MPFKVPKVPEVPKLDPALVNKITAIINDVSIKIIEGTPAGEIVEDVLKDQIKEAVMREIEPMLDGNKLLVKPTEKLIEKGIDKAWDSIKEKLKTHQASKGITQEPVLSTEVKFCPKCGGKVEESWKICQNCGAKLDLRFYEEPKVVQLPTVNKQPISTQKAKKPPFTPSTPQPSTSQPFISSTPQPFTSPSPQPSTPPIAQPLTQEEQVNSDPYYLCEHYEPLPSGNSCKHYDERTYDCPYYGIAYCPLNKEIARFRAKKKYFIAIMRKKMEKKDFKTNEYYNDYFDKEFMKKL